MIGRKKHPGILILGLILGLLIVGCDVASNDNDTDTSDATEPRSAKITLNLLNTDSSDRGHWGIHAWVMKGTTYIDTLEYYGDYSRYVDAKSAAADWINDSDGELDGISSATLSVSASQTSEYTLEWDGKNYNGSTVPAGTYTIKLIVSRHTSTSPFGTPYTYDLTIGRGNQSGSFSLADSTASATLFPYNIMTSNSIAYTGD